MSFYKTVKQNAKRALAGGWGKAIGLMLIAALPLSLVRILDGWHSCLCRLPRHARAGV